MEGSRGVEPSIEAGRGMTEAGRGMPSEASRMLEAALEQMDGIIQGAKFELPQFENCSLYVSI